MQDRSDQQLRTAQERTSGIFSAVCKGDTVLLGALRDAGDILKPDELGINLTLYAIKYDRPEVLQWLHQQGYNLDSFCDSVAFGSPMFYAVQWNRLRTVETLDQLGYDVYSMRCDKYNTTPLAHARRLQRTLIVKYLEKIPLRDSAARTLQRYCCVLSDRRMYLCSRRQVIQLQRWWRRESYFAHERVLRYLAREQDVKRAEEANEAMIQADEAYHNWDESDAYTDG